MSFENFILSARITGFVMNFPLYDGGVSQEARRLIADGRLAAALEEYQRLAATGSAIAKCVLAYLRPLRRRDPQGRVPVDFELAL